MRYTAVQRIIGNERGLKIRVEIQCVLPALSSRFQCDFDKYKNAGCSVVLRVMRFNYTRGLILELCWTFPIAIDVS